MSPPPAKKQKNKTKQNKQTNKSTEDVWTTEMTILKETSLIKLEVKQ